MKQLPLPLPRPEDTADAEFMISQSNADAAHSLRRWGAWPVMSALLVGPRKSGRSLLGRVFAGQSGGTVIDDAERQSEEEIFHAWNEAQRTRRPLLIIADAPPPEWTIALPDLRSRLVATPLLRIGKPDDALMQALLERGFERRRLDARPELIQWLMTRLERSHVAIVRTIDSIDDEVKESRKRLSIPLARGTLVAAGLISDRRAESGKDSE